MLPQFANFVFLSCSETRLLVLLRLLGIYPCILPIMDDDNFFTTIDITGVLGISDWTLQSFI